MIAVSNFYLCDMCEHDVTPNRGPVTLCSVLGAIEKRVMVDYGHGRERGPYDDPLTVCDAFRKKEGPNDG